jgi:uncharacterized protein (TIGR03083 family)
VETWDLVDAEREDIAAFLEGLTPDQWEVASLCGGWRVRDVAAHLRSPADIHPVEFLGRLARTGLNFNKAVELDARLKGEEDPAQIIGKFRATIGSRTHPPFTKAVTVLNDMVVHHQDIRRPLGLARQIPEDRLRACLDFLKGEGFPLGTKKRIAGLGLEATDLDWRHGDGPPVRGSGEALVLVLAGRRAGLADLEGEGVATLTSRM